MGLSTNIFSDAPFSEEGKEIAGLLRRKAPDEDFEPLLNTIQSKASEQALDPLVTSTDVFMTAVCAVGSKSLSHVLACIDRTKGRLLDVGLASDAARTQIITAVMAYWHAHPGTALSIVEKLLNYSILTPFSVADWALAAGTLSTHADGGNALAQPYVFELVSNTVAKVTGRVHQVLGSPEATQEEREKEVKGMRDLFRAINDALASWAGGSKDELMEDGDGSSEREALLRRWGQRWLRVFQRVAAVEEAFVVAADKDRMVTSE